jgi:hypothetical protein
MNEFVIVYVFSVVNVILHSIYDRKNPFLKDVKEFFDEYVYDVIPILSSSFSYIMNIVFKSLISNEGIINTISKKFGELNDTEKKLTSVFCFNLEVFLYFLFVIIMYMYMREIISFVMNINDRSKDALGFFIYMGGIFILFLLFKYFQILIERMEPLKLKNIWKVLISAIIIGVSIYVYYITLHKEFVAPKLKDSDTFNKVKNSLMERAELFTHELVVPAKLIALQIILTIALWVIFFTLDYIKKNFKFNEIHDKKRRSFIGGMYILLAIFMNPVL